MCIKPNRKIYSMHSRYTVSGWQPDVLEREKINPSLFINGVISHSPHSESSWFYLILFAAAAPDWLWSGFSLCLIQKSLNLILERCSFKRLQMKEEGKKKKGVAPAKEHFFLIISLALEKRYINATSFTIYISGGGISLYIHQTLNPTKRSSWGQWRRCQRQLSTSRAMKLWAAAWNI